MATKSNNLEVVKELCNIKSVNINATNIVLFIYFNFQNTPLHVAVSEGNIEIVKFLCSQKDIKLFEMNSKIFTLFL